jgi:hypothetical protein
MGGLPQIFLDLKRSFRDISRPLLDLEEARRRFSADGRPAQTDILNLRQSLGGFTEIRGLLPRGKVELALGILDLLSGWGRFTPTILDLQLALPPRRGMASSTWSTSKT